MNCMSRIAAVWCVGLAIALLAHPVQATPVTWNFAGTVSQVFNPENVGNISVGDSVSGSITFETSTPESDSQFGGLYKLYTDAIIGWSVTVGGYTASLSSPTDGWMNMQNDLAGFDGTNLVTYNSPTAYSNGITSFIAGLFSLELNDSTMAVFNSPLLPTQALLDGSFDWTRGRIGFDHVFLNQNMIEFEVSSIYGDPVPAPGALALLCLGLLGIVGIRRRKII